MNLGGKRVLVTGGGFIGSHLVKARAEWSRREDNPRKYKGDIYNV